MDTHIHEYFVALGVVDISFSRLACRVAQGHLGMNLLLCFTLTESLSSHSHPHLRSASWLLQHGLAVCHRHTPNLCASLLNH